MASSIPAELRADESEAAALSAPGPPKLVAPQTKEALAHRLEYIDGLRALAALWVVFHHAIETSQPTAWLHAPIAGAMLASLFFGQFPVMVFLMLSGFCLYYPYVRKNPARPDFSSTGFWVYIRRRAKRIAPPYLAAGALCIALTAVPDFKLARWTDAIPFDAKVIASHLLFIHNLFPSHALKIDYPMWSIGLEWQLYLLFPLLMWGFNRYGAAISLLGTLGLAALVRATYRSMPEGLGAFWRGGPFSYLEIFALGMLAASLTLQGRRVAPRWVLVSVAIGGFVVVRAGQGNGLLHDLATSAAAFCILLLAINPDRGTARVLSQPALVRLGLFSYSLYLVHAPLLQLCWLVLRLLHLSPEVMFAAICLGGVPLILVGCYLFHLVFERPFMRVKPSSA